MAKIKIRHVAISTEDPERTAAWYKDIFGLEEVGRSPTGGIYLSDGETNFAVLRLRSKDDPNRALTGVNHFGFMVDDPEAIYRKLEAKGSRRIGQVAGSGQYFEVKFEGPDGQIVDVSHHGWVGAKPLE
jgi:catechol 2,3-dioxygenase-like lactoylglutathione lyase family enzyme